MVCPSPIVTTASGRGEGEQLAEPPYAAKIERVAAVAPACLEFAERGGHGNAVPFVIDVQQSAAFGAGDEGFVDGIPLSASRRDTGLKCEAGRISFQGSGLSYPRGRVKLGNGTQAR